MSKIYNEIVIDMNPESHSYMEVLHEDSFEHNGDMMLAQGGNVSYKKGEKIITDAGRKQYYLVNGEKVSKNPYPYSTKGGSNYYKWEQNKGQLKTEYPIYEWNGADWVNTKEFGDMNAGTKYDNIAAVPKSMDVTSTEWGAAEINKDDFIDPATGKPRPMFEIAKLLDPKLPGVTGDQLMAQIRDMAPKYTGVDPEEKKFAKEAMQKDVYGLSKEARKVGAQARGVYGGTGASMRGAMTGTEDIAKGFKQAQQGYQQDLYGLEKGAEKEFEAGVEGFLEADWFVTPEGGEKKLTDWSSHEEQYAAEQAAGGAQAPSTLDIESQALAEGTGTPWALDWDFGGESGYLGGDFGMGKEGGFIHKDGSGVGNNRKFNGETFLDLLTRLPEAGGS